ncbi:hypothetical protein GCM10023340_03060 [Nocardioides marinquilinus]|uniref:Uncharacterized protein n=1 Tax=Nocardioides marinquilinus TaxID=1210400 RepID=A0ABP9P6C6_9ACTN
MSVETALAADVGACREAAWALGRQAARVDDAARVVAHVAGRADETVDGSLQGRTAVAMHGSCRRLGADLGRQADAVQALADALADHARALQAVDDVLGRARGSARDAGLLVGTTVVPPTDPDDEQQARTWAAVVRVVGLAREHEQRADRAWLDAVGRYQGCAPVRLGAAPPTPPDDAGWPPPQGALPGGRGPRPQADGRDGAAPARPPRPPAPGVLTAPPLPAWPPPPPTPAWPPAGCPPVVTTPDVASPAAHVLALGTASARELGWG